MYASVGLKSVKHSYSPILVLEVNIETFCRPDQLYKNKKEETNKLYELYEQTEMKVDSKTTAVSTQ